MSVTTAQPARRRVPAVVIFVLLVLAGVARSAYATRLDGFTIDETYHITAGASYVLAGDYRLNPEHPPLVKLWVGAALAAGGFRLPELRPLEDKLDERHFTNGAVFSDNDPDRVRAIARAAMLALNGLLLLLFALAAQRLVGGLAAGAALAFLVVDPTVAAHMPVVMTDLPVALLAVTSVLLAALAFRSWRPRDLVALGVALGLALGAKHSGLVVAVAIGLGGLVAALLPAARGGGLPRTRRLAAVAGALALSVTVLWSTYQFSYAESGGALDTFNRPLAAKIADVRSPALRGALELAIGGHLLPRAYVWGLADVIRAGVEGRAVPLFFFGRLYQNGTPFYFFPATILVKVPLGLLALVVAGAALVALRHSGYPLAATLALGGFAALYLLILARSNNGYAGVRHALPIFPVLALAAAAAVALAWERRSRAALAAVALAATLAAVSALPFDRPWEYYNEIVGGRDGAARLFNDEGVDLGQRTAEIGRYCREALAPEGTVPYDAYGLTVEERNRRGISMIAFESEGFADGDSDAISGTLIVGPSLLFPYTDYADFSVLRDVEPVARFGNARVYQGTFTIPGLRATGLYYRAAEILHAPDKDPAEAEPLLARILELYPRLYPAGIDLGNLRAAHGDREGALRAFKTALANAPAGQEIADEIARQIDLVAINPPASVPPLRNPWAE